MYDFEIVKPATLQEALAALGDEGAQALAGGQTLIPTLKARLAMPERLVALSGIAELRYIRREGESLEIGGATTHRAIAEDPQVFSGLASLAGRIGDPAVRSRGTIGGSIANNDPSACYPAAALACDATILTDRREIAAADYFQGMFATALEEGEIVTGLRFAVPRAAHYLKFEQPASRFALVGVFVARYDAHVGVAVTGASNEGVFRWEAAEAALAGDFSKAALADLPAPEAEGMISDIHGSAEYRAHLVKVLTGRAVEAAA